MGTTRRSFLKDISLSTLGLGLMPNFFSPNRFRGSLDIIKPTALPENATLGFIAPASPIYAQSDYDRMIESLKGLGYTLVIGAHVKDRSGYLAGKDEDRVADLHAMFKDESIDGILCTRGGYGSNRILNLIDFELIRSNPKVK